MSILSHIERGSILQRIGENHSSIDASLLIERVTADLHPGQRAFVEDQSTQIIGLSAG